MSLIAQLVVDLQYQDADGVDRILSCGKEVVLAHVRRLARTLLTLQCTFLTSSCQLPVYSENDLLDPSAIARHGLKLGSASGPLFCAPLADVERSDGLQVFVRSLTKA